MSMLRATIQGLEVQRGTMATLKSLGASFAAAVKQPETAEKSLWESPYASAFFHHAQTPPPTPAEPLKAQPAPPAPDEAAGAAQMANPAVWWNVLQEQFTQAVSSAMSPEAVASATAMASEAAAQFAAAAGTGLAPGTGVGPAGGGAPADDHHGGKKPAARAKPVKTGKN